MKTDYYRVIAQLGVQVAGALEHAHALGILHRDIKPSNLLLDLDGTVWVADFGLAKTEGADALTHTGDIVGTFRYMAPERFRGASDQRSDVYGLGITLYEMLILRPAFTDLDRVRLVERVTQADPPRPRQLDQGIPRDLETIVLKAIAKEPRDRYQTAAEVREDLHRFLADRPIRARRTPWQERSWRWCRRNPAVAGLLGMVAILLVTVAAVSTILAAQLNSALGQTKAKAAEREGRLREAEGLVGQAHGTRFSRNRGRQVESLALLKKATAIGRELDQPPEWFDRLRNEAIACMALLDLQLAQEWSGYPRGSFHIDFDDALERYARSDKQGAVSVRRISDDVELCRLEGLGGPNQVLMSPNGRYVASGSEVLLKIWWLPDGLQPVVKKEAKNCSTCAFSPDSRQAAIGYGDGSVEVYDLASGQVQRRLEVGGVAKFLAFHPKEQRLAVACPKGVHVYDLASGKALTTLKDLRNCDHLAWHPDGATLGGGCALATCGPANAA